MALPTQTKKPAEEIVRLRAALGHATDVDGERQRLATELADAEVLVPKPLELKFDPDELGMDELCLLSGDADNVPQIRKFLRDYSNWSRAEIGAIKRTELLDVYREMIKKGTELLVPLAS